MKPFSNRVIVNTPGTPVPLSDHPFPVKWMHVFGMPESTTVVYIGGANVRARTGERVGAPLNGGTRPDTFSWGETDLSLWWIDAVTALEGVTILAGID